MFQAEGIVEYPCENVNAFIQVACVEDFLKSDKYVHVMRDHPAHGSYMLGGTWGTKVVNQRKEFLLAFKKMFKVCIMFS